MEANKHDVLQEYAWSMIGLPYRWGGHNAVSGFDCSGLVTELLTSIGMWPEHQFATAQDLYNYFSQFGLSSEPDFGALIFYGVNSSLVSHVSMVIMPGFILEAGGGGSKTLTSQDAAAQNAFVRVRPIAHRAKEIVAIILPSY